MQTPYVSTGFFISGRVIQFCTNLEKELVGSNHYGIMTKCTFGLQVRESAAGIPCPPSCAFPAEYFYMAKRPDVMASHARCKHHQMNTLAYDCVDEETYLVADVMES